MFEFPEVYSVKNVYFVQVDSSAMPGARSAYLPYTAGLLAASAWKSETVKTHFLFKEFIFLREDPHTVAARMKDPAVIGFCCYCWNTEYNKAVAAAVKERYPGCVTVFGGHNVPDSFSFLEAFPYIDILCHGEGEQTIRTLLETIALDGDLREVPNISFRGENGAFVRTASTPPCTLDFPSPYLNGWFDEILAAHPEIAFNAILETSRGCPHRCAYCDWGLLKSKVRLFPMERVKAEIEWFSRNRIAFVWGADANFGLFNRDLEIADLLVRAKEQTGYPERMRMNYAKNNDENVFAIAKKFKDCNFDRFGATLSFQSMSPEVLKNIGRSNADLAFYKNLLTKYNKENIKVYSELIVGLPGETYESFIRGVGTLFEIGQHLLFQIYVCILLPNAFLAQPEIVEKYGLRTVRAEMIRAHAPNNPADIPEYVDIIVENNTMSRENWIRAMLFYYFTATLHAHGFLRVFAIYLYAEKGIPYEAFYDGAMTYLETHPAFAFSSVYAALYAHSEEQSRGLNTIHFVFSPCGDIVWDDNEYFSLRILESFDLFYEEISPYLRSFGMEEAVFNDLMLYQKSILRRPGETERRIRLRHDVHGFVQDAYINDLHPVREKEHTLTLRDTEPISDWKTFGKQVIWYGRMGWASYKDDVFAL